MCRLQYLARSTGPSGNCEQMLPSQLYIMYQQLQHHLNDPFMRLLATFISLAVEQRSHLSQSPSSVLTINETHLSYQERSSLQLIFRTRRGSPQMHALLIATRKSIITAMIYDTLHPRCTIQKISIPAESVRITAQFSTA